MAANTQVSLHVSYTHISSLYLLAILNNLLKTRDVLF